MATIPCPFPPVRDGYAVEVSYPSINIALEGGPSRRRRDYLHAPHTVELTWLLTSAKQYTQFMGFFRSTIKFGTEFFLLDLITDMGVVLPHRCRCLGNLPKLTQQRGSAYWTSATLEVEPNLAFTGACRFFQSNVDPNGFISISDTGAYTIVNDFPIEVGELVYIIDSEGIHETGPTPLNLDGFYEVTNLTTSGISIDEPYEDFPQWQVLMDIAGGTYGPATQVEPVTPTLFRLPT